MVSSSLDKSIKKALAKDISSPSDSTSTNNTNNNNNFANNSGVTIGSDSLLTAPSEKIQLLFPKCKPRNDYQNQTSTTTTSTPQQQETPTTANLKSIAFSSSHQSIPLFNTQAKFSASNLNMNNNKQMKLPLSPDHKQPQHPTAKNTQQYIDQPKQPKTSKHEQNDNYVETNPFRIGSNNRYFYNTTDSLFNNNNSGMTASNNNGMMHHYHYPPSFHQNYQMSSLDRNLYLEPDEIEHNPYMDVTASTTTVSNNINTIPSSILKTTPPETPPALTTTPVDSSPIGSNRNLWDLSPIKTTTPTRIKTQSPVLYSRSHRGSYKKLLSSPVPIEEDLETGHYYYNNKKPYYQAPQTDSDSNEPATFSDIHEVEKVKHKILFNKSKIRHSESSDVIYAEVKKKDERKIVKSKSGSGIMEYDGSPRRFGMSSSEDVDYYSSSNYKFNVPQSTMPTNNYSSSSPPRPGFPQRILSFEQRARNEQRSKSPLKISKSYSFDDKPITSSFMQQQNVSSTLIPTTFINSSAYELPEETPQTIEEEPETCVDEEKQEIENNLLPEESNEAEQNNYEPNLSDIANSLQITSPTENIPTSTFDYLYEFSETRKVLEEFFKCPDTDKIKTEFEKFSDFNESDDSLDIQYDYRGQIEKEMENMYIKQNVLSSPAKQSEDIDDDNRDDKDDDEEDLYVKTTQNGYATNDTQADIKPFDYYLDSVSRSSIGDDNADNEIDLDNVKTTRNRRMSKSNTNNNNNPRRQSKNFNYSPDTTDYDSNYGDFDSESSMRFLASEYPTIPTINATGAPSATVDLSGGPINNYARYCTSMPVLEDGLSSGHASDNENNNPVSSSNDLNFFNKRNSITSSISTIQKQYQENLVQQTHTNNLMNSNNNIFYNNNNNNSTLNNSNSTKTNGNVLNNNNNNAEVETNVSHSSQSPPNYHSFYPMARYESKDPAHNILNNKIFKNRDPDLESLYTINTVQLTPPPPAPVPHRQIDAQFSPPPKQESDIQAALKDIRTSLQRSKAMNANNSPTPVYNASNNNIMNNNIGLTNYYDRTPVIPEKVESPAASLSPVWIPRSREKNNHSPVANESGSLLPTLKNSDDEDEEEIDTDLETDRLLGHQMLDDGFYDDKTWAERKPNRSLLSSNLASKISPKVNQQHSTIPKSNSSSLLRHGLNTLLPTSSSSECCAINSNGTSTLTTSAPPLLHQSQSLKTSPALNSGNMVNLMHANSSTPDRHSGNPSPRKLETMPEQQNDLTVSKNITETADLCNLESELVDSPGGSSSTKSKKDAALNGDKKKKNKNKEVLIEGVLFRARYLGSTQLVCEGQPTKSTRMLQAEEAVSRIKALAPDGENQPSTEVDLFISTEKIMVLNTDLKEIMMDHALRTISYIADIGDLVVLMARRRFVPQDVEANSDSGTGTGGSGNVSGGSGGPTPPTSGKINRTPKMICHVFESDEAQFIAQSIGQAFQVAYMEFLKANGIEDHSFMKEMDYQEVLNSQEIFGDELEIFAKKELQKEVVVPKAKGEILGVVIVESGWGSMLPTVVIANLASNGAAARCGQLNIGDQIIAINGLSLVGLPLSQCQTYIKNTKNQTVVKFTVVPCAPVVEVKIKRPNTKYQLGFSVQNGVICSLLRGGIAERGGVRVGHRIIEINNQSVVAVPHEKIVNLLATSVGEILMKTMPTSMFRLLTGQENPIYI